MFNSNGLLQWEFGLRILFGRVDIVMGQTVDAGTFSKQSVISDFGSRHLYIVIPAGDSRNGIDIILCLGTVVSKINHQYCLLSD